MKKTIFIFIAAALVVAGGSFYGGMKYQQSKSSFGNFSRQNFENMTQEQQQQLLQGNIGSNVGARRVGVNFVSGEIINKDNTSLTIKMPDGSSKIVFFSDSTEVSEFAAGETSDLEVGKTVSASGATNQDGSLTAQSIQIRSGIQNQP